MATPAQIFANQKNAALSTGPRTADGKTASSKNAIKHGLSSAFKVLAHEDQEEFDRLVEDMRACYRPRDIHQRLLVNQMAKSQWLLARAQRLQTAAYDILAGAQNEVDPDTAIVNAMRAANPDIIGRLERYAATAERSFYKAYRELTRQNEASLIRKTEAHIVEMIARAPMPDHPQCENLSRPVQNEPNRPTAAELALRL